MPQSKSRHPHKHNTHHNTPGTAIPKPKKTNRSIIVTMIFFALIGLGISYFLVGNSIVGLLIGVAIGAGIGYIFAWQVNRSLREK